MKHLTIRLRPGQDLKKEIEALGKKISAGVLLSIVGGLKNAKLRMPLVPGEKHVVRDWDGPFEIVSGTGTISQDGCHIHISISDVNGQVLGGHLKDNCIVKSTVEVVILDLEDVTYRRRPDTETGFDELAVE